ncbi:molybdenum cofactor guanylyltransferase MobA [Pararobbsia alpina]|uniref:Molybdenum cofactor guanylyltransferase n=1 Tax=Pararobbsia alpina TaxID=621374 RepID=A0A6S7CDD7_9BURK|nr:molybdenum cofactor guanylyltransferase MobA [Pararobbsia alpina]CAB3786946.1 Molybdenum cofactor guanylyltransferase [Pararobbsia alpina]
MINALRPRIHRDQITGLILAGGQGSRMGGVDKGLQPLCGRPLVEHAIERLQPQVGQITISANRNVDVYQRYGFPVWLDSPDSTSPLVRPAAGRLAGRFAGPLAGIATGLAAARTDWLLIVPCDAPLFPLDLATKLIEALVVSTADLAFAATTEADGTRQRHPVFALLPTRLAASAAEQLASEMWKLGAWYGHHNAIEVSFRDSRAFYNANTLRELQALER